MSVRVPSYFRLLFLSVAVCGMMASSLHGQQPGFGPAPGVMMGGPSGAEEQRQRDALYAYVLGLLYEREDQVLEAVKCFERAAQLDPRAAAVQRNLVPLYLALERNADALAASRKVLELTPQDHAVWYLYARQLKDAGKSAEAKQALQHTLTLPSAKEHPDLLQQVHVELAVLHDAAEEYVQAAEALLRAGKILEHPDPFLDSGVLTREMVSQRAGEVYERAGKLYLRVKRYDDAVAAFRLGQRADPASAGRLNFNLAQICLEQNRLPEALEFVDGYLRLQPQGADAYEMKIALLKKLNREAEILPWLERATRADPYNQGLKVVAAKAQARAHPDQAEKIYLDLVAENPTPDLYRGLLQAYQESGTLPRGLALLDKTVTEAKLRPPMPGRAAQAKAMILALRQDGNVAKELVQSALRPSTSEYQQDTVMLLAGLADHHRQSDEAERLYRKCLKGVSAENEPLVYGSLLRLLWKARKVDEVIQLCQGGLKQTKTTNHVLFHNDLAKALARQGKHDEALAEANRALALAADADRFAIRCLRVRLMCMANQLANAEAECLTMLKDFAQPGETLETRYLLSNVYSTARNMPKSEEQLELILKVDPNNATVCNDLGYIWADQNKNLERAEELIRRALEMDRRQRVGPSIVPVEADHDNASYVDSLGWVLYRRGQIDAARKELERAAAMPDGDDPTIWDHLGDVYHTLRQPARARSAWQRSLQLYEQERSRPLDDRYREVQRKYKAVEGAQ